MNRPPQTRRADLSMELRMTLSMLSRDIRHNLWRTCEPQHQEAVDSAAAEIEKVLRRQSDIEPEDIFDGYSSTP